MRSPRERFSSGGGADAGAPSGGEEEGEEARVEEGLAQGAQVESGLGVRAVHRRDRHADEDDGGTMTERVTVGSTPSAVGPMPRECVRGEVR